MVQSAVCSLRLNRVGPATGCAFALAKPRNSARSTAASALIALTLTHQQHGPVTLEQGKSLPLRYMLVPHTVLIGFVYARSVPVGVLLSTRPSVRQRLESSILELFA